MKKIKKESSSTMNWKLIVVGCSILILIFTIILVSVLSSVQQNYVQLQKIQSGISGDTLNKNSNSNSNSKKEGGGGGAEEHRQSPPPGDLSSILPAINNNPNLNRDYTIPYKLPPTPQDEELWFDELMKLNRLKPPPLNSITNNNSLSPPHPAPAPAASPNNNNNNNNNFNSNPNNNNNSNNNNKHYNQRIHIDSGNFRVQLATIWDPHPSYRFRAFGKDWRIDLVPSTNFVVPGFRVTEHHEGGNQSSRFGNEFNGCFYNGVVNGDEKSSVAVSLCHGMTGHIRTSEGSYFIEPTGEWKGPHIPIQHVIYKLPSIPNAHQDDVLQPPIQKHPQLSPSSLRFDTSSSSSSSSPSTTASSSGGKSRVKRSMSKERHVELMVAADTTMTNYHGPNLRHYILTLLSIVALVYRDASIGNPINIALVNLHILKDKDFARKSTNSSTGLSASDMLRNFCKWQKDMNEFDDNSVLHHDTALLLTRETICRNPWLGKCDTLGLAELGTMCDHYASCALVQDNGLSAAFTIAHELGHVMNMPHDDDYKCQSFISQTSKPASTTNNNNTPGTKSNEHYVMSRMLDHNTYPWAWSKCSRHYLTEFLDAGHGSCLEDKPLVENLIMENSINDNQSKQPGEIFNEHKQCQLVFGHDSKLCSYMPVCRRLWCTTGDSDSEGCRTQHMPWADGTPCGDTKWCLKGACVLKDLETLRIVDGGWGGWGDYGECSRSCGGGVRRSLRECDNPSPSNGGKYCTGPRVRYESCNTYECEKEMKDYRLEQCAKYNDDNFNIQGLPKDVQWVPKYTGISPKDRCKLFCRVMGSSAYYLLKEKVVDGTPCGPDTFDICVNGACLPAGCDRRLHSRKVLDICGVCGGDGSTCHTQSGSYNETSYGYSTVVRIPSGASSIDIRQISATSRDDNYLALLDPTSNEYLLNGHFVVSMFRKNVHGPGTILEYSGSDSNTERINSSRPIQSDLVVQVLSVGKLTKPNIHYQFVISTNNRSGAHGHGHGHGHHGNSNSNSNSNNSAHPGKFSWKINSFNCSSPCYGNAIPKYDCYRDNNIVNSHYCTHLHYPMLKVKYCNTHCKHSWKLYSKSDCILTTECGKGFKNLNYKCSLHYNNGSSIFVGDEKCSGGDPKPDGKEPCVVQCDAPKWKYGAWGECDTICGDGWQVRSGICHFQNQVVDPHYCGNVSNTTQGGDNGDDRGLIVVTSGKKLTVKRKCNDRDCGNWKIDQWSPCSRTCGDGYSRAAYACYLGSSILPPDYCLNSPRPVVERKCDLPPCHQWQLGNYNCEQCGINTTREIKCTTFTGGQVTDDYNCDGLEKPDNLVYCGNCPLPKSAPLVSDESVSDRDRLRERERDRDRIFNDNSDKNSNREMPNQDQIPFEDLQNQDVVLGEWMTSEFSECTETSSSSSESVYVRIRQVTCSANDCNPDTKPVKTTECGMWSTGKWSECNSTCGLGHEIRAVTCTFDSKASLNGNCASPIPSMTRECLKSNKCQWKLGPFSKCSKNCGNGVRIRQVVCEGEVCVEEKPNAVENCNNEPCPLWVVGEWTECSSTCGGGIRERSVRCLDWDYKIASETKCADLVKPNATESCSEWDCGEINSIDDSFAYRWNVGTWSNCTKKCGKGFKLRDVNCTKLNYSSGRLLSKAIVTDENCRGQKPRAKRGCARFPCAFKWITSPWSECSRECGYGIQERSVSCHRVNKYGWIDPDPLHSCNDEDKPKNYNYCFLGDCQETYRWKTDPWTPCTSKCGKITRQKRRVYCISTKSNGRVNANNCKEILKPNRKRKCPVVQCGLISCNGLQNGNQIILVGGKNITIYCHNGREYINLNNEENFSEVYEKRLIRPETCPRDGVRLETCECIVDRNRKSGFTFYDKIGINVTNLRVQADDYEFTRQVNGQPINYGEAGDCYSSVNCPQGRFSINLNGTGFSVSPETVWTSQGHRASMWIHKSKDSNVVTGRCGGYCGTCSPHRLTGIKVQV